MEETARQEETGGSGSVEFHPVVAVWSMEKIDLGRPHGHPELAGAVLVILTKTLAKSVMLR